MTGESIEDGPGGPSSIHSLGWQIELKRVVRHESNFGCHCMTSSASSVFVHANAVGPQRFCENYGSSDPCADVKPELDATYHGFFN